MSGSTTPALAAAGDVANGTNFPGVPSGAVMTINNNGAYQWMMPGAGGSMQPVTTGGEGVLASTPLNTIAQSGDQGLSLYTGQTGRLPYQSAILALQNIDPSNPLLARITSGAPLSVADENALNDFAAQNAGQIGNLAAQGALGYGVGINLGGNTGIQDFFINDGASMTGTQQWQAANALQSAIAPQFSTKMLQQAPPAAPGFLDSVHFLAPDLASPEAMSAILGMSGDLSSALGAAPATPNAPGGPAPTAPTPATPTTPSAAGPVNPLFTPDWLKQFRGQALSSGASPTEFVG